MTTYWDGAWWVNNISKLVAELLVIAKSLVTFNITWWRMNQQLDRGIIVPIRVGKIIK